MHVFWKLDFLHGGSDLVGLDPYWSSGWSEASIGGGSIDFFVDWSGFKTVELQELHCFKSTPLHE